MQNTLSYGTLLFTLDPITKYVIPESTETSSVTYFAVLYETKHKKKAMVML